MIRKFNSLSFSLKTRKLLLMKSESIIFCIGIISILICFSEDVFIYLSILIGATSFLGYITCKYIQLANQQCPWELKTLRYDCQINNFQNKISIVSSIIMMGVALGFGFLLFGSKISALVHRAIDPESAIYLVGFFKLVILYGVLDKIHGTRILTSLYERYSTTLKHMTIERSYISDEKKFPLIYLDGAKVNELRYRVVMDDGLVGVTFSPALSLGYDSVIEFYMVKESLAKNRIIYSDEFCDVHDHQRCFFSCRNVIIPKKTPPLDSEV